MSIVRIAAWITGGLVVLSLVLYLTGWGQGLIFAAFVAFNRPSEPFDPAAAAPAPDYSDPASWAALPDRDDLADLVPEGVGPVPARGQAPVDVFFVHPTGFVSGDHWTSPMDPGGDAEQNTQWMLANQASVFNGCCNVYAPRYREATLFAYFQPQPERDAILAFAYGDVLAAFEHYLEHMAGARPFIIASHSQGSHHTQRLLAEKIDGSPLHARLVAAYTIGSVMMAWSEAYFTALADIEPCREVDDLGCVVHLDTWADGGPGIKREADSLCTNPLTWSLDGARAAAELHDGAVAPSGAFRVGSFTTNPDSGDTFPPLAAPMAGITWAQCRDGVLYVADQSDGPLAELAGPGGNYHGLDYPLFHMDIRNNAKTRVARYLTEMRRSGQ